MASWNLVYMALAIFFIAALLTALRALAIPGSVASVVYSVAIILLVVSVLHWLRVF